MIKQTSFYFFKELRDNNSTEWFKENNILYQEYKSDYLNKAIEF